MAETLTPDLGLASACLPDRLSDRPVKLLGLTADPSRAPKRASAPPAGVSTPGCAHVAHSYPLSVSKANVPLETSFSASPTGHIFTPDPTAALLGPALWPEGSIYQPWAWVLPDSVL